MSSSLLAHEPAESSLRGAVRALRHIYGIEVPAYQLKVLKPVLERLGGAHGADAGLERLLRHDSAAWDTVIDAITVPETYFFRHYPHFTRLRELASARLRRGRPCRVLSAGCSSGEEVWSAVAVLANLTKNREHAGSVVGWDVNARRLIEASEGRYREWSVRTGLHGYESAVTRVGDYFQVSPALRAWARFEVVNLMAPPPSVEGGFDAIFFRNVAIYFDPEVARAVFERLSTLLTDDGLIFVGPSDPVSLPSHAWEHVIADGVRTYRRITAGTSPTSRGPRAAKPERARWSLPPHPPRRPLPLRVSLGRKVVPRRQKSPPPPPAAERPDDGDPLAQISSLADQGDYARALELLTASKLSSAEACKWEGVLRLNLNDALAAVACLRRCVYLDANNISYRRWLAVAFEAAGMVHEASRERRNARELETA